MKPLTQLRTDLTIKAIVQAPGAMAAAAAAFVLYEDPTAFEFAIGFGAGALLGVAGNGWMMWTLRRKPLPDSPVLSLLSANAVRESTEETRWHHLARLPVYLVVDVALVAVFAIIGAGLLLATTATSLILAWRLRAWEKRSNNVLFYERQKLWELRWPKKPYWYYEPVVPSS